MILRWNSSSFGHARGETVTKCLESKPVGCRRLFAGMFLAALVIFGGAFRAQAQESRSKPLDAQAFVIQKVGAGEIADLKVQFPDARDRVLDAGFLEKVLTGEWVGLKMHRHGIRIAGGVVNGALDLANATIAYEIWLDDFDFNGTVDFSEAECKGRLSFASSRFHQRASFTRVKVKEAANFGGAEFTAAPDFSHAQFGGDFNATKGHFNDAQQTANFNSMRVTGAGFFNAADFAGGADFGFTEFGGNVEASHAHFNNPATSIVFGTIKVGGEGSSTRPPLPGARTSVAHSSSSVSWPTARISTILGQSSFSTP
jgi:hypothetical protein